MDLWENPQMHRLYFCKEIYKQFLKKYFYPTLFASRFLFTASYEEKAAEKGNDIQTDGHI